MLCSIGCNQSETRIGSTSVVTGSVSYEQKPLAMGTVLFEHKSGKTVSADIQSDGTYRLEVIQGPNRIAVISREPVQENPKGFPPIIPGKSLIPEEFASFRDSGLSEDIEPGENHVDLILQQVP
jgi:hypothetical protein